MTLAKGTKAPEFTLIDSDTKEVNLKDYQGKNVLLLFFPFAFSVPCTAELCEVRDGLKEYQSLNVEILAISVDGPFTLAKFKEINEFKFKLLTDFNKSVATAYDCIYEEFIFGLKGVAKRSAFVIDRKGTIQYAEVLESAKDIPNFAAIKETLKTLN